MNTIFLITIISKLSHWNCKANTFRCEVKHAAVQPDQNADAEQLSLVLWISVSGLAKKVAGHQGLQLQKVVGPKKTLITNNK